MEYNTGFSGDVLHYDNRIFSKEMDAIENPVIDYFTIYDLVTRIYGKFHFTDSTKVPVFKTSFNAASAAFKP